MRAIVCGGRNFHDVERLFKTLDLLKAQVGEFTVVSGAARGADQHGEEWAISRKASLERFPADWNQYGKRAGYMRNKQMLDTLVDGDIVVAFWDGSSPGTKMMIDIANQRGKLVVITVKWGAGATGDIS